MIYEKPFWTLSTGRKLFFDALRPAPDGTVSGVQLDPPLTAEEKQEIATEMRAQWAAWAGQPRRRHVVTIVIGADTEEDLAEALMQVTEETSSEGVMGGPRFGYYMTSTVDESVTHESYFAALNA